MFSGFTASLRWESRKFMILEILNIHPCVEGKDQKLDICQLR